MEKGKINNIYKKYFKEKTDEKDIGSMAILIDIYGIIKIMNFYNDYMLESKNKIVNGYTTTFITVIMNLIYCEISNYIDSENKLGNVNKDLRYAVHQFRQNNFKDRDLILSKKMGISIDSTNPMLDFIVYFLKYNENIEFVGSSIWENYVIQNNFEDITYQEYVNSLMSFFRSSYNYFCSNDVLDEKYKFSKIDSKNIKLITQPYSFVSLIRKSKIKNEILIKRLIIAYSQLAIVDTMFNRLIKIEEEIKDNEYILYFINKVVALVLDETFDNINSYIKNSKYKDNVYYTYLNQILDVFYKINNIEKNSKLRNNFHYSKQDIVFMKNDDIYEYLHVNLKTVKEVKNTILDILNIKYRRITFAFFRLLAWSRYGYEKNKK